MSDNILELKNINKSFNGKKILKGIDISIKKGEFVTFLGSSGCGKTTMLRIISGLETPDEGSVILEGKNVTDFEPNKRDVNTVFQNYALFPHMNIEDNISYSLKIKKINKIIIKEKVNEMLSLMQLEGFNKRFPSELSGGQKQRVAVARSLINKPKILLLDEPLAALDLKLRRQMQIEIKRLQKKLGISFVYITHDQEEALNMSDRIAVLNEGKIEQVGTPTEIYDFPKTSYVASFVEGANIVKGKVKSVEDNIACLENPNGKLCFNCRENKFNVGQLVTVAVRSENAEIYKREDSVGLAGVIKEKSFSAGMLRLLIELKDKTEFICSRHGMDFDMSTGDEVSIKWLPDFAVVVDLEEK